MQRLISVVGKTHTRIDMCDLLLECKPQAMEEYGMWERREGLKDIFNNTDVYRLCLSNGIYLCNASEIWRERIKTQQSLFMDVCAWE